MSDDSERPSEISKALVDFERDPTIQNYVALRRRFPEANPSLRRFSGLAQMFAIDAELKANAIDHSLVIDVFNGDIRAIDELSLKLMEKIIERRKIEKKGQTQLQRRRVGISDAFINYMVVTMLESVERNNLNVGSSLFVLMRERLGGPDPIHHKSFMREEGRWQAIAAGAELLQNGTEPSVRAVARKLGVQPSTVSRWFPADDLRIQAECYRETLRLLGRDKQGG
jgi:hypothetical protein